MIAVSDGAAWRRLRIAGAGAAIATLLAVHAMAGQSSAPSTKTVTFDDAIRIALAQSTSIKQAQNAAALDAASVQEQKLGFLPDLRLSTSGSQNVGRSFDQSAGSVVNQTTQSMSAGLSSSITLFDGLKNVSSLHSAQLSEQAGEQDLVRTRQTAVFTVASNFLTLVSQQEQLRVQQENLTAQEAQEAQIKKLVDAGSRPISDLYQQQATTASARSAIVDAQRAVELAKVDLIQTLQLDPSGTYAFTPPAVSDSVAATRRFDLDTLLNQAFAHRSDLAAERSRVEAADADTKAAAASRWPTVSLTAGYSTAYNTGSGLSLSDQLDQRRGGSVGIGVSIPLFDRGSADLATQRAEIAADNARLNLQQQRQSVALDVRRAYLDFQAAQARLTAAEAQEKAAALAVDASRQRYDVGAATLVEVSQARATLVQAQSAVISARYTLVFQQSLMSYYTGSLDPSRISLS